MKEGVRAGEIVQRIRALVTRSPPRKDWVDVNKTILEVIDLARSETQTRNLLDDPILDGSAAHPRGQNSTATGDHEFDRERGGGDERAHRSELLISSAKDGSGGVCVSVADSGRGLGEVNTDWLFEAFYGSKPEGMGMGNLTARLSLALRFGERLPGPSG